MRQLKLSAFVVTVICVFVMSAGAVTADTRQDTDILSNTFYKIRCSIYESMPRNEGGIVFLGDSLTDYIPFNELLPGLHVINRGIAGDNTLGVLNRLDEVISLKPSKLFLLIGTNDIVYNVSTDRLIGNIRTIIRRVKEGSPSTKIYLETLMPTNPNFKTNRPNETINAINRSVIAVAEETGCKLVDTNSHMAEDGILPLKYTVDGIHFNGAGIVRWVEFLEPFVKE